MDSLTSKGAYPALLLSSAYLTQSIFMPSVLLFDWASMSNEVYDWEFVLCTLWERDKTVKGDETYSP